MNDIIAGDPAPTNPTARNELLDEYGRADTAPLGTLSEFRAKLDAYRAQIRAEVLAEAIEAARSEYLTDGTGTDEDNAYNNGITDAVAAIGALTEAGAR